MISQEMILAARNLRLHLLKDPYRPTYHFVVPEDYAMPADPNGAVFWNGPYHLGYLRILIDKSVVEVFANERQSVRRRIYPSQSTSVQVKLFSTGGATRAHSLTGWAMMPANPY